MRSPRAACALGARSGSIAALLQGGQRPLSLDLPPACPAQEPAPRERCDLCAAGAGFEAMSAEACSIPEIVVGPSTFALRALPAAEQGACLEPVEAIGAPTPLADLKSALHNAELAADPAWCDRAILTLADGASWEEALGAHAALEQGALFSRVTVRPRSL